eukprot:Hpha_TRINITY_DN19337_c0_g1::TRINITY_DN19337_c0_g1_i1::g.81104::m.81104
MQALHTLTGGKVEGGGGEEGFGRLHCSAQGREAMEDLEYWRAVCPKLPCCDPPEDFPEPLELPDERVEELRGRLQRDGFFVVEPEELNLGACCDVKALRDGVEELRGQGWQATFATMYDGPWMIARHISKLLENATGGGCRLLNSDWLGYHVLPPDEAGMPPHRDFEHCPRSSWADEERTLPRVVTVWVALSDCGPENSCLYFLPARCDPGYRREEGGVGEAATKVFQTNEMFQDIACCPLKSGSCVVFTHRVFHWGSSSTPLAKEPRVALAFGFSDPKFKAPYIGAENYPLPPLSLRLALNAGQMLIYNKRHEGPWPLTSSLTRDMATLSELWEALDERLEQLDGTYARTVLSSPVIAAIDSFRAQRQDFLERQ